MNDPKEPKLNDFQKNFSLAERRKVRSLMRLGYSSKQAKDQTRKDRKNER
jgi:hypothetical protein